MEVENGKEYPSGVKEHGHDAAGASRRTGETELWRNKYDHRNIPMNPWE